MTLRLSNHVRRQAARRGIDETVVSAVATMPEQVVPVRPGREAQQSRIPFPPAGDLSLVRVFIDVADGSEAALTGVPHEQDRQILEDDMRVNYDEETDTLTVVLREAPVAESDEGKPGVILDYDDAENLVSIEVLDASARVENPRTVTLTA